MCQSLFRSQGQIVGWWHADEFAKCNLTFDPDLLMNYPFDFLPFDVLGLSMRWPFDDVLDCRCVSIHLSSRSCPSIKWWSMSCPRPRGPVPGPGPLLLLHVHVPRVHKLLMDSCMCVRVDSTSTSTSSLQ